MVGPLPQDDRCGVLAMGNPAAITSRRAPPALVSLLSEEGHVAEAATPSLRVFDAGELLAKIEALPPRR